MNLIEGIQAQCNRVRDLIPLYELAGPESYFAVAMMRAAIREGEVSIASGDTIRMIAAHRELEGFKE